MDKATNSAEQTAAEQAVCDVERALAVVLRVERDVALAAGLERLMGNEALRERFAPQRIRGMWWSLFDELLAEQSARGSARVVIC